jgi:hypothetical protein
MIAYKKEDLGNRQLHEDVDQSIAEGHLTEQQGADAKKLNPSGLYTPNIFARIAFMALTVVIILLVITLTAIPLYSGSESDIKVYCFFMALVCYGALELMVHNKKHFSSGIDDVLIIAIYGFLITMAIVDNDFNYGEGFGSLKTACALLIPAACWMAYRFVDAKSAMIAFLTFCYFIFLILFTAGDNARLFLPFILGIISFAVYYFVRKQKQEDKLGYHIALFKTIEVLSLLTLYVAGNILFVYTVGFKEYEGDVNSIFIKLRHLIWAWTLFLPFVYIGFGIKLKDSILIRIGLMLIAVAIFTFRARFAVMPIETAFTIGGLVLLAVSYLLIRYLKTPKYGFSFAADFKDQTGNKNIEALVIAETIGRNQQGAPNPDAFQTGGGGRGFDGGGAEGEY